MLLPIDTRRINTRHFSFMPTPRTEVRLGSRRNPVDDFSGDNWAARLFIGFNVGTEPRWSIDDLLPRVRKMRQAQGAPPDATYIATRGVFTHGSGRVVEEDGAQVIIFAVDEDAETFQKNVLALAETLVRELEQEAIFVELQKNGLQVALYRARP